MAPIISWQFMGWLVSRKTCAAASRALSRLGVAALSAAADAVEVWAAAARFFALASVFAAGAAGAVDLSSVAERLPFWGSALVTFFFLVAMMHLLREWVKNPGSAVSASPTQVRTVTSPGEASSRQFRLEF